MEYAITFADVMTGLIGIGLGVFGWLVKNWISGVLRSNEETKVQVKVIDKKIRMNG